MNCDNWDLDYCAGFDITEYDGCGNVIDSYHYEMSASSMADAEAKARGYCTNP